ncbi:MAG: carbohydrate ABC transporter substrate-binding protein [Verrucomicrobia bacterium]|nr:carbohydrate ABC transporter substrate-binding protein [Verrucomicrobiota bacterium]
MKTCSEEMENDLTRRQFIRYSGKAALAAGLTGFVSPLIGGVKAATSNNGLLVVISQTGAAPDKALPRALKEFEAANPGLTTKLVLFPEEKFVAMYTAAKTAGEQVDFLNLNGQDLRRYATSNALLSCDSISYQDRFITEALTPYTVNGHLWGLPAGAAGGFVVFTNRALLEKLGVKDPATYDELKQIGDALRSKGLSAFTHPGKVIYMWPVWFFTTFAQTTGNRSIERTTEILAGKGKFTDPDVVEALDLVFRFSRDKLFSPGVFGLDFANAQSEFQTGKACFYLFHDSIAKGLHDAESDQLKLDFMLMPNLVKKSVLSQFPGGPGLVMAIPAQIDPSRKEAALHLLDFLSSDAINRESMQINGGAVPVNVNVQPSELPFYQKEKTEIAKMVTYLDWFYPPEITTAMQEGLQSGLAGRITAEALAKNLQALLERLSNSGYRFAG